MKIEKWAWFLWRSTTAYVSKYLFLVLACGTVVLILIPMTWNPIVEAYSGRDGIVTVYIGIRDC